MVNKARSAKLIKSSKTGGDIVIDILPQIQTRTSVIPDPVPGSHKVEAFDAGSFPDIGPTLVVLVTVSEYDLNDRLYEVPAFAEMTFVLEFSGC